MSVPLLVPPLPPPTNDDVGVPAEVAPAVAEAPTLRVPMDLRAAMRASTLDEREALRRSRMHESWYGWQMLTLDAAATGVLLLGASFATSGPPRLDGSPNPRPLVFAGASVGIFALGGPVVHFAHGDVWQGFASLGLRVALPLAGYALGSLVGGRGGTLDSAFGAMIGGVAASAADASLLGWQRWVDAERGPQAVLRVGGSF
jgi:hypothetical protein